MMHLELTTDHPTIERDATTNLHLLATLRTGAAPEGEKRPPRSIVFTLDTSGSMAGPPLAHLVRSMERLLDLLKEEDRFGIVAFDSSATELFPLARASNDARSQAKRVVRGMTANGSTAMDPGLRRARELLGARKLHERQAILLLTDGYPNVGVSTAEGLAAIAAEMRPDVTISTLGYGTSHDEDVLIAIANAGGGNYHFIADPALCQLELARALGAQADIVADAIELHVAPAPGVRVTRVIGAGQPQFGPGALVLPLAPMAGASTRTVALAVAVDAGHECRRCPAAEVRLVYRRPGEKESRSVVETLAVSIAHARGPVAVPAVHALLVVRAEAARLEAREIADRGDFAGAAALLESLAEEIVRAPGYAGGDGSPLSEAYEQLVDDAAMMAQRPDPEAYHAFKRSQRGPISGTPMAPQTADARHLVEASAGAYPKARLTAVSGPLAGRVFPLRATNIIGRTPSTEICLPSARVSRQHASVFASEGEFWVACLGSSNGTYVNGTKVATHKLALHDRIELGDTTFVYDEYDRGA